MTVETPRHQDARTGQFAFESGSPGMPGLLMALCLAGVRRLVG